MENNSTNMHGTIEVIGEDNIYNSVKCIKAIANDGYSFFAWTGDTTDIEPANPNIPVEHNTQISVLFGNSTYKKVYANFIPHISYSASTTAIGNGICQVLSSIYPWQKTIVANPNVGYLFDHWDGPSKYVNDNNRELSSLWVSLDATYPNAAFTAYFVEDPAATRIQYYIGENEYLTCIYAENEITQDDITSLELPFDAKIHTIILGKTVNAIGEKCFYNLQHLSTIQFSQDLTSIGNNAFENTSLQSFDFSKLIVDEIPSRAFAYSSLSSIYGLNSDISAIGQRAFISCIYLTGIYLPSTIAQIDDYAFYGCDNLVSVDMTEYVKRLPSLDENTFNVENLSQCKIYLHSTNESYIAYESTGIWNQLYEYVVPQIDFNPRTILEFSVPANESIALLTGWLMSSYVSCKVDIYQQNESYAQHSSIKPALSNTNEVRLSYNNSLPTETQICVVLENALSSIVCTKAPCVNVDMIGSNVKMLPKLAFSQTLLTSMKFSKNLSYVGYGCLKDTNVPFSRILVENGNKIQDAWIVLSSGVCTNVFQHSDAIEFDASNLSINTLAQECFTSCNSLQSVELPSTLTHIERPLSFPISYYNLSCITIPENNYFEVVQQSNVQILSSKLSAIQYLIALGSDEFEISGDSSTELCIDEDENTDYGDVPNTDTMDDIHIIY